MKSMTVNEKNLLDHLEQHAARLHYLQALFDLFIEASPFSQDDFSPDIARQRHLLSLRFLAGFGDLMNYYQHDLTQIIHEHYTPSSQHKENQS